LAFEYWLVTAPCYTAAIGLGLLFAAIGLNVQHDANHGAISAKPWVNTALGLTQDWIGGNSLLWLQQHVTLHHVECNDLDLDTDMMDSPMLRFSPTRARYVWQSLQGLYFVLLEAGYAMKVVIVDWYNLSNNMYEGVPVSKAVPAWRWYSSVAARLLWLVRFVVVPVALHGLQVGEAMTAKHGLNSRTSLYPVLIVSLLADMVTVLVCLQHSGRGLPCLLFPFEPQL
jgi:fatty acid desaturase (delta-4 desaturase)